MSIMFFFIYSETFKFEKKNGFYGLLFTILFKRYMPRRIEKLVRDSEKFEMAKFEIARLFLGQRTVNAQGTETFVRNSEVFEIARVRDSACSR